MVIMNHIARLVLSEVHGAVDTAVQEANFLPFRDPG